MSDLPRPSEPEQAQEAGAVDRLGRDAALAILEPLVGLLLLRGIRMAEAEDLLKLAFVRSSARAFAAAGKLPTVSTLSVATGLRRREVKRLLEQPTDEVSRRPSAAEQVRLRWATGPQWADAEGRPRPLRRVGSLDEPGSFAALCASVSRDTHARALLDELSRSQAVEVRDDEVVLRTESFRPPEEQDGRLRAASANVSDHLNAALLNLLSDSPPLTERALYADGLTETSAREAAELARMHWQAALPRLRAALQSLVDRDRGAPDATWRARIGLYGYYAPEQRPEPPVKTRPARQAARRRTRP